jgi:hypothetical protein
MTDKKLHWTQTPEGKERMSAAQKAHWVKRKKTTRAHKIVAKAVAKKNMGERPAILRIIKALSQRRDALSSAISILREEVKRG